MAREEPVVGVEAEVRASLHGFCQQMGSEAASQRRRNSVVEEEPHVTAASGSRPLEGCADVHLCARLEERHRIVAPVRLVEIDGQEPAHFILQQWVHTRDEWLPVGVVSREVPANDIIGDREEPTMLTVGTLDARLLADPAHPLVRTGRGVA